MRYKRPPGTNDVTPQEAARWHEIEQVFADLCECHNFGELRTPIFEDTDLFIRSVGEGTDIVAKEMYTFQDRGGRSLTLRAEGTAPAVRAYLENHLMQQDPERVIKLYYVAPIFRYDRPQAGRYRQHTQFGLEIIGSPDPATDAEIIQIATEFYQAVGITNVALKLNSVGCPECAPAHIRALKEFAADKLDQMCEDCVRRYDENPLRMVDCKNERCRAVLREAPIMVELLCVECAQHFAEVRRYLGLMDIPYELDPHIVRGLDYYTRTAFEFVAADIGAQSSVGGGGRYDGLVEQMGGPPTPGVGIGIGVERVLLVREELDADDGEPPRHGCFIVTLGDAPWEDGLKLAAQLRAAGLRVDLDYRRRSMKAQLRHADKEHFAQAVIIGEDELATGLFTVKDLESGAQEEMPRDELPARLQARSN